MGGMKTESTDMTLSETPFSLPSRKEVPALIKGSAADIFLPNWSRGRPAALDVTVISTLQNLTLAGAAATQGHALRIGEELPTMQICAAGGGISGRLE